MLFKTTQSREKLFVLNTTISSVFVKKKKIIQLAGTDLGDNLFRNEITEIQVVHRHAKKKVL